MQAKYLVLLTAMMGFLVLSAAPYAEPIKETIRLGIEREPKNLGGKFKSPYKQCVEDQSGNKSYCHKGPFEWGGMKFYPDYPGDPDL